LPEWKKLVDSMEYKQYQTNHWSLRIATSRLINLNKPLSAPKNYVNLISFVCNVKHVLNIEHPFPNMHIHIYNI